MAEMKNADMKMESSSGWKAQVLSLYQSLVVVIFGSLSFILRLMQEYFKAGDSKSSTEHLEKMKSSEQVSGKGRLRSAGEHKVEEEGEMVHEATSPSEHTVVELPPGVGVPLQVSPPGEPSVPASGATEPPKMDEQVEPKEDQSKNTLVIKNLPFKFKPADLDSLLNEHHAKPKNVRLLRDETGRFSGMAFIRCPSKEEAQHLISSMNGLDIGGRNIQVEFKLKKKKGKGNRLDLSCDSLSSSSDELPGNRLRISSDTSHESAVNPADVVVQPPIIVQSAVNQNTQRAYGGNKLASSAENLLHDSKQPFLKKAAAFQPRRKSTSSVHETSCYTNSAMSRLHSDANRNLPSIRPVRQPTGPDGTNGFSLEYKRSRGMNV